MTKGIIKETAVLPHCCSCCCLLLWCVTHLLLLLLHWTGTHNPFGNLSILLPLPLTGCPQSLNLFSSRCRWLGDRAHSQLPPSDCDNVSSTYSRYLPLLLLLEQQLIYVSYRANNTCSAPWPPLVVNTARVTGKN